MKKWQEPRLSNLGIESTQEGGECLYKEEASTMSLFPIYVWGDGKKGCTYWDCTKKGCTNPNYGMVGKFWPCPPVKSDSVGQS